jgi:hypothetical protein
MEKKLRAHLLAWAKKFSPRTRRLLPLLRSSRFRRPWRTSRPALALLPFLLVTLPLFLSLPLSAWKPVAHVHLAEVARLDAINDGKVEIFLVDYENGKILRKLGDYAVEPNILKALASGPYYRAGAWAADAVSDIAFAQLIVHPKPGLTSTDQWLQTLWNACGQYALPSPQDEAYAAALIRKAFVLGFMTHAAGDMFGHSYVNKFAGGPFVPVRNALRHMAFESYIDKRTPDTTPPDFYTTSIAGLEDFIYENMLAKTDLTGIADFRNRDFRKEDVAPVRFFNGLADWLQTFIDWYNNSLLDYQRQYNAKIQAAKACKSYDPRCSKIMLYKEAADIVLKEIAFAAGWLPLKLYVENWIQDIRDGLKTFPAISYELHVSHMFRKPDTYYPPPDEALYIWQRDYMFSMLGLPDVVGQSIAYNYFFELMPEPAKQWIERWKGNIYNFLMESALGTTMKEIEDTINSCTDPFFFDRVPTLYPTSGCWMPMADFNRCELKIQDRAYDNPDERYDWRKFRAAFNTVIMNKLVLLSRDGLRQLLADLNSNLDTASVTMPPVLGYIQSFDENKQGFEGENLMFLARDPVAYKKIFMRQIGINFGTEAELECKCPPPETGEGKVDEEVVIEDLAGKFSHLELEGRLQGMAANDRFLVIHTVLKDGQELVSVFAEPDGRMLWQKKYVSVEAARPPNPYLYDDRVAFVAAETKPASESVCFYVFDAASGKTLFQKRAWSVGGFYDRYVINGSSGGGEVLDLKTCREVYTYIPSVRTFGLKAIIGSAVLLWRVGGQNYPYAFSLNDLKERWADRKFANAELDFFRQELYFRDQDQRDGFPALLAGRPKTKRDTPFPFYLLNENGEGKLLTPSLFGIAEPNQSCGIDFSFSREAPQGGQGAYLVAGINTMHLRKADAKKEVMVALDGKGRVLGRAEISLEHTLLYGSFMDRSGNLVLSVQDKDLVVSSYSTPALNKNYEKTFPDLDSNPSRFMGDEIFVRGRVRRGNDWFHVICSIDVKKGAITCCYVFPVKSAVELMTWGDHMWGTHNTQYYFIPFRTAKKPEAYRIIRIPRAFKGTPAFMMK